MCLRGHPGKTGIGKCTLVVAANSESVAAEAESPPSPELRVAEKRNVVASLADFKVASLADDFKAVSINREEDGAAIEGKILSEF